jgi:hypothetical protein
MPGGKGDDKSRGDFDVEPLREYLAKVQSVAATARLHPDPNEVRAGLLLLAIDLPRAAAALLRKL